MIKDFLESSEFKKNIKDFFRPCKLIFRALPNHYEDPILTKTFAPLEIFDSWFKKNRLVKKTFLAIFRKFIVEKDVFFF